MPNYEAWCRLIHYPDTPGERPGLMERHIVTEELGGRGDAGTANAIRQRSRSLARPREEVEQEIERRTLGAIGMGDIAAAELLE